MGQAAKRADGSDCTLSGLLTPAALVNSEDPWTHTTGEKTCWSKGMYPSLTLAAGPWPWVSPELPSPGFLHPEKGSPRPPLLPCTASLVLQADLSCFPVVHPWNPE